MPTREPPSAEDSTTSPRNPGHGHSDRVDRAVWYSAALAFTTSIVGLVPPVLEWITKSSVSLSLVLWVTLGIFVVVFSGFFYWRFLYRRRRVVESRRALMGINDPVVRSLINSLAAGQVPAVRALTGASTQSVPGAKDE
jgi:hypothetical protein